MYPETVLPKHCTYNSLLGSYKRLEVQTVTISASIQQGPSGDAAYWNNTAGQGLNPRTPHSFFLTSRTTSACSTLVLCILQIWLKSRVLSTGGTKSSLSSSLIYASVLLRVSTARWNVPVNYSPCLIF